VRQATVIASIAWKDLSIWLRRPVAILTTLVPTIMYVLVVYYISVDVGTPPIAVVAPVRGPAADQLVSNLRNDGGFRATVESAGEARRQLADMDVAAVVTIPATLGSERTGRSAAPVTIKMNNLNADIANDLRRSLAFSVTAYNTASGSPPPISVEEHHTYAESFSLAQFRLLPGLILILSIAGIVNTGLATCQEFEGKTFKELVLAPAATWSLVAGKIMGGWLTTLLIAAFIWAIGLTTGLYAPTGLYLLPALLMTAVVGLAASCVGVAMGAALRQFQLVTSLSVTVALYLFFAAGGVSVFGFLPHALQDITTYDPLYYGIHALVQSVLISSLHDYLRDLAVVLAFALAAAGLSTAVLRRRVMA
jgi:ABC-type multidrug transport system permease subunit